VNSYVIHLVDLTCIYVLLTVSLNLLVGYTGLFTVTHGALYGVGAYASSLLALHLGLPLPVALLAAVVSTALVGALVAVPSLRVSGDYLVIASLAMQVLIVDIFLNLDSVTGGPQGLVGIPAPTFLGWKATTSSDFLPLNLVCTGIGLALAWLLVRAPFGRTLKTIREDEIAAASLGKSTIRSKIIVCVIASGMAGAAGSLAAYYLAFVDPTSFGINVSIYILSMVIVGGASTIRGSILGPIFIVALGESLRFLDLPNAVVGELRQASYGLALIIFVLVRPQGIAGEPVLGSVGLRVRSKEKQLQEVAVAAQSSAAFAGVAGARPRAYLARQAGGGRLGTASTAAIDVADSAPTSLVTASVGGRPLALSCRDLVVSYHRNPVLHGLSLDVEQGEIVAIIGHNGAGKSTVLNAIAGLVPVDRGQIFLEGRNITNRQASMPPDCRVGLVPQNGGVFSEMTVYDNLVTAGFLRRRATRSVRVRVAEVLEMFPVLADRRQQKAVTLSGGQQRTLALAMALVPEHRVLLLDEPSIGLSPVLVESMLATVKRINSELGITVVLNEQNVRPALEIAHRAYVLKTGEVHLVESAATLLARADLWRLF
jgi:ABC-type branched-subunit amino acid transport system ATPase component/ABC-type branched-subunit amino acid transport system permease subunit